MRKFIALSIICLAGAGTAAQSRDRAAAPSDAALLATGWNAVAAGQHAAAARSAAQVLSRSPWSHAALSLQIEALAQTDGMKALDAYEAWLGTRTVEDASVLEPVPRMIVLGAATGAEGDLRVVARRLLREAGIPLPASATREASDQLADAAARARTGDAAALKRLEEVVTAGTMDPDLVARTLESSGPPATPLLVAMLEKPAGPARAAAAAALGRGKAEEARAALKKLMKDPDPMVRSSAAVALARMGDAEGQASVDRMLQSEVPDLRLMAAEAWDGKPGPWTSAIAPLLENRDGTIRLEAARLLAGVDPEAARKVLSAGAADTNPAVRAEAARIMEETASVAPGILDVAQARRLLRESDGFVRLHAAGVLLAAARSGR